MMGYIRPITWEPGTFLRSCDICGIRFRANQLTRGPDGKFRCIRWCAEQTQLERDRISADSSKRREAPPPPFGVPYSFKDAHTEEAVLFNFLANSPVVDSGWPGGIRLGAAPASLFRGKNQVTQGSYSAQSAGETMRYLYGLIVENKRPTLWITRAKQKLAELADWTYLQQIGIGTSFGSALSNDVNYGAVTALDSGVIFPLTQALLGRGMLFAYQALGDSRYLESARGFADSLSTTQRNDLLTIGFTSTAPAGADRISYGTWGLGFGIAGSFNFFPGTGLLATEFLSNLLTIAGDETHGADTTISGTFISPPARPLSQSIAAARAFWSVGAYGVTLGKTLTGLSAVTPFEFFQSFNSASSAFNGSWNYSSGGVAGSTITGSNYALALRSLFALEGYSATVSSIWSWLMAFTSNPTFQPTTTSRGQDAPTVNSLLGVYNPKLSLTSTLRVRDPVTLVPAALNASSTYALECAGYLAPIQTTQDSGSLELAKDFISKGKTTFPDEYNYGRGLRAVEWSMLEATCGLGGQPTSNTGVSANSTTWDASKAAVIGQMYRLSNSSTFQI